MNSDPNIIKIILEWLYTMFGIAKSEIVFRLYAHKVYSDEFPDKYWSECLGISISQLRPTIYKPTVHSLKKNLNYKGCMRVELRGSDVYWKVMKWRDMLYKSF